MKKKFSTMKLQNRFLLILLLALTISATLFELLWLNKWTLVNWTGNFEILQSQIDDEDFWTKLDETAQNLSLPESSDDEAAAKAIKPLLDLADKYTSIYLYEQEDGLYITGQYAKIMDEKHSGFRTFFDLGYRLTDGEGEDFRQGYLQFQNGKAQVVVVNYQRALFIYPYMFLSLLLSVLVFLGIVLFFMNRKMREVLALEQEILLMSTGDLTHPVPQYSKDEIGILANELNHLRISLNENIVREQESRKANQDLITALSHDLRTPLTILTGYLEVLKLGRTPEKQADYLDRCLKKASDIKVIDIEQITTLADYFIIASGSNRNQVQAMADNVDEVLGKAGYQLKQTEGYSSANWILLDYGDIVIHLFDEENRLFYDLERIWRDGKVMDAKELKEEQ